MFQTLTGSANSVRFSTFAQLPLVFWSVFIIHWSPKIARLSNGGGISERGNVKIRKNVSVFFLRFTLTGNSDS